MAGNDRAHVGWDIEPLLWPLRLVIRNIFFFYFGKSHWLERLKYRPQMWGSLSTQIGSPWSFLSNAYLREEVRSNLVEVT